MQADSSLSRKRKRLSPCKICDGDHQHVKCPTVQEMIRERIKTRSNYTGPQQTRVVSIILDSACTQHMIPENYGLVHTTKTHTAVTTASGETLTAEIQGELHAHVGTLHVRLRNVLYVPGLVQALLSVRALSCEGFSVAFAPTGECRVTREDEHFTCTLVNNQYTCDLSIPITQAAYLTSTTAYDLWHERLGHPGNTKIRDMAKLFPKELSKITIPNEGLCNGCMAGKITRRSYNESTSREKHPLALIHIDTVGPIRGPTVNQIKYFLMIVDDHSRYVTVELLQGKTSHEVLEAFQRFKAKSEKQTGYHILKVRSDNGTEFTLLRQYLASTGVKLEYTVPHTPEQNGRAERANRSIIERTRTLLYSANLPGFLWSELVRTATHLHNRLPSSTLNGQLPRNIFYANRQQLDISYLRTVGSLSFVHLHKSKRDKLAPASKEGYLLGYGIGSKAYRIWFPKENQIHEATDVRFDESRRYHCPSEETQHFEEEPSTGDNSSVDENVSDGDVHLADCILDEEKRGNTMWYLVRWRNKELADSWEPHRNVSDCDAYRDWVSASQDVFLTSATSMPTTPTSVKHAMTLPEWPHWKAAIAEELKSLEQNNTWEVLERTTCPHLIDTKWCFRIKTDSTGAIVRFKCRLVARGFNQWSSEYDQTYAPVLGRDSLRLLLAATTQHHFVLHQCDVKTAFLHSPIDKDIFLTIPECFTCPGVSRKTHLLKLKKSLYGLKQSPYLWSETLSAFFLRQGFRHLEGERCLFVRHKIASSAPECIIGVYVDDILIAAPDSAAALRVVALLSAEFEITDMGTASHVLGMRLMCSPDFISMDLEQYIDTMLRKYCLTDSKRRSLPCAVGVKLHKRAEGEIEVDKHLYQSLVGTLTYISTCCRPDISMAVNLAARFSSDPGADHLAHIKGVFGYLRHTRTARLVFRYKPSPVLDAYCDADWAGGAEGTGFCSTTGFVIRVNGTAVSWRSAKQTCVARSTMEAESLSLSDLVSEVALLRTTVGELFGENVVTDPTVVHIDNEGTVRAAISGSVTGKARHFGVRLSYVKSKLDDKQVRLNKVSTHENPADMLTKPLGGHKFTGYRRSIGVELPTE